MPLNWLVMFFASDLTAKHAYYLCDLRLVSLAYLCKKHITITEQPIFKYSLNCLASIESHIVLCTCKNIYRYLTYRALDIM